MMIFLFVWGQCADEGIIPSDAPVDPSAVMQYLMTRARMRQLNLKMSSFLSNIFYSFENRLLPNT